MHRSFLALVDESTWSFRPPRWPSKFMGASGTGALNMADAPISRTLAIGYQRSTGTARGTRTRCCASHWRGGFLLRCGSTMTLAPPPKASPRWSANAGSPRSRARRSVLEESLSQTSPLPERPPRQPSSPNQSVRRRLAMAVGPSSYTSPKPRYPMPPAGADRMPRCSPRQPRESLRSQLAGQPDPSEIGFRGNRGIRAHRAGRAR